MSNSQLLQGKHAVVFGAGGSIGTAVGRTMAAQGAEVFLAGRTKAKVEELADSIAAGGGRAHAAVVDALDDRQVNEYLDGGAKAAGSIEAVFNAVGPRPGHRERSGTSGIGRRSHDDRNGRKLHRRSCR